ncbi:hypothetical protein Tco_0610641 [Tanacetum coccineum]
MIGTLLYLTASASADHASANALTAFADHASVKFPQVFTNALTAFADHASANAVSASANAVSASADADYGHHLKCKIMSITKEQQQALDDALVPREQRLTIGSCNYRPKLLIQDQRNPQFIVALDVLSILLFIKPSDPLQEHPSFMFQASLIKHFVFTPFLKKDIFFAFSVELGYLEPSSFSLCQGPQIFEKETSTCTTQDSPTVYYHTLHVTRSIDLRRNKVDWHMANDDPILTTMRFIPQHEVVQKYGAILPNYLTTQAMKESEAYKTYHALVHVGSGDMKGMMDDDDQVSNYEPSDDEANDDLPQSRYAEEEEVNVEQTFEANINLEGRDAEMTDAPKTTQVIEDTHVTLTPVNPEGQQQSSSVSSGFISNMLNSNPDTGINSVLNVKTTSLVDVLVTSQATTTLPQPSNPFIPPVQQIPTPTLATTPSSSLLNLLNFGSLFEFDDRLQRLEADFSEFKQTNQYATALSSIPNIVENYLGSKLKESMDVAVQLKSDRLREEAQTENESFLNNLDATMQTIIKE